MAKLSTPLTKDTSVIVKLICFTIFPVAILLFVYSFYLKSLPGIDFSIAFLGSFKFFFLLFASGTIAAYLIFPQDTNEKLQFVAISAFFGFLVYFVIFVILDFFFEINKNNLYFSFFTYFFVSFVLFLFKGKNRIPSKEPTPRLKLKIKDFVPILLFIILFVNVLSFYLEFAGRWLFSPSDGPFHLSFMEKIVLTGHLFGKNEEYLYYEQVQSLYNYPPILHSLGGIFSLFTGTAKGAEYLILSKSFVTLFLSFFVINFFVFFDYCAKNKYLSLAITFLASFFFIFTRSLYTAQWSRIISIVFIPIGIFFLLRFFEQSKTRNGIMAFITLGMTFLTSAFAFVLNFLYFAFLLLFKFFRSPNKIKFVKNSILSLIGFGIVLPFYKAISSSSDMGIEYKCLTKSFFLNFFNSSCNASVVFLSPPELYSNFIWILFLLSIGLIFASLFFKKLNKGHFFIAVSLILGNYFFIHTPIFHVFNSEVNMYHYLTSIFAVSTVIGLGIASIINIICSIKQINKKRNLISGGVAISLLFSLLFFVRFDNNPWPLESKIYRDAIRRNFISLIKKSSNENKRLNADSLGYYLKDISFLRNVRNSSIPSNEKILMDAPNGWPVAEKGWSMLDIYNQWYLTLLTHRKVESKPFEAVRPENNYKYFISYGKSNALQKSLGKSGRITRFMKNRFSPLIIYKYEKYDLP